MGSATNSPLTMAGLLEMGGPALTPLDVAVDYWRSRLQRLLPLYVLAMLPHALVSVWLIAAITGERRSLAGRYCIYLTAATIWRWIWISRLQHGVQQELRAQAQPAFWSRLPQILMIRLLGNACMNWGIVLVGVPVFYGFFLSGFAAPLVLESDDPATVRVREGLNWIRHSSKRLMQMLMVFGVITLLLLVALFISQLILCQTVLPTLLTIDTADLNLTLNGWAWRLSLCYFIFLALDAFWSVASVLVYYDAQSRRTATDLKARLTVIVEGVL